MKKYRH